MSRLTPTRSWIFATAKHSYMVVAYLLREEPPAYQFNAYRFNDDGTWELHHTEPELPVADDPRTPEDETGLSMEAAFAHLQAQMIQEDAT